MVIFFDYGAPSPRRVRIFLAEKRLQIPTHVVDLAKGEQFSADYRAKNARCTVPMLELDDGTCLWDTLAICEYFEALHPQLPLFGGSPLAHAQVVMWYQRIECDGFQSVAETMRNASPAFKDRALPGTLPAAQIPALVERGRQRTQAFYRDMNAHLETAKYVAGDFFSLADIQLLCILDFATGWGRMPIPETCAALIEWHRDISARPSAKA